jgi:predicted SAM-dependent methyltransferase
MGIKLNLGASPIWKKEGWHVLDHKLNITEGNKIAGDATKMDLADRSCDVVFCSHVFEHIPHTKLPLVLSEINRVLKSGGTLRLLTPDLKKIAKAYIDNDEEFFLEAKEEDPSLRTDLGFGGMMMNFIVSPGQDTILVDRNVDGFIAGYAHIYSYDFNMLKIMLGRLGFEKISQKDFCISSIEEFLEPLHVESLPPVWENMSTEFYKRHNLQHELIDGSYHINFKVTGFDRDPLTSLIIECEKQEFIDQKRAHKIFNQTQENYNRYAYSLLYDDQTSKILEKKSIAKPQFSDASSVTLP